jgi:hypothetical protein
MRKFSSYGSFNIKSHGYALRQPLVDQAVNHLIGETTVE